MYKFFYFFWKTCRCKHANLIFGPSETYSLTFLTDRLTVGGMMLFMAYRTFSETCFREEHSRHPLFLFPLPSRPKFLLSCSGKVHITSMMQIITFDWHVNSGYSPTIPQPSVTKIQLAKMAIAKKLLPKYSLLFLACGSSENITLLNSFHISL